MVHVVQTYGLWEGELDYVNSMVVLDLRNNSAWNQRYFIISNTTTYTPDVIAEEVQ